MIYLCYPLYLCYAWLCSKYTPRWKLLISIWFSSGIWLLLLTSQPHKEERFMYVIYPAIVVLSSHLISLLDKRLVYCIGLGFAMLSMSRVTQIYVGYSAPMRVWEGVEGSVCVGKEWHLFPSSYFFDGELKYYADGFTGLLPGRFGGNEKMNSENREEYDRYIDIQQCQFVAVSLGKDEGRREELSGWEIVRSEKYLDPSTLQPFKSFYLGGSVYGTYQILKNPHFITRIA